MLRIVVCDDDMHFAGKPEEMVRHETAFQKYFRDACTRIGETEAHYSFSFNKELWKVAVRDIVYFESRNRVVYIFMADDSAERFYGRLNTVEKELSEGRQEFLRIHQSFLVNYSYMKKMTQTAREVHAAPAAYNFRKVFDFSISS